MEQKVYEVLEHPDFPGLTVGNYARKPGERFARKAWDQSEESLKKAIEDKRSKLVSGEAAKPEGEAAKPKKGDK
jgi:hypothetical protein